MARSTGIVLAAGAVGGADLILNDWDPLKGLKLGVGVVLASFIAAGLDKVLDGFGTGLAIVLLLGAILSNGPKIVNRLFPT